ncbi:type VI secretion system tip protein VgrG [Rosenbergiella epipactidis]|uniref:type VI secretion system Vgr family protein n=1 Tax=Rosenbergiella epipactidis TaxID=1544694 RepID=UPI001BDA84FA|nr:type VI secretion system tip protein TssI/VgrG [Rosenbergiella epipactidis]MBT0717774.1 type VI secretion system tip protein VgrG [Rosenbergiella epipactidis]
MSRTIMLHSSAIPRLVNQPALVLTKLEGEEAFSTLYTYTLTVKTPDDPDIPWQTASNIDLKALIGKEMTITIELDGNGLGTSRGKGKSIREISGLVEKARYVGRDASQAMYEIILRPWLFLAELTTDFKIFQAKNVVEIIDEVLSDYNFAYERRLTDVYPALDFQVQYGETDFAFIQRLMEEWGIYWFFEHHDGKHKLVLVDHVGAHRYSDSQAYKVIHYLPETPKADKEYVRQLTHQEALTSGRWVTNDYDFTKSRADILAMDVKPRKTHFNDMEIYQWPGDYDQPDIGEKLARVRIEELGAQGSRASGNGELRGLACGINFTLKGHPINKANREYMVISSRLIIQEIEQRSQQWDFSVECDFTVQPTTKIYRHPQTIARPRTHGPQNAIVVGPAGEELWTDSYGRVKVRFLWDRYGQNNDGDSCWIRVSQAWAGNSFGGLYIPRINQEVIVDFINGDPDRPLIIGSLYNNITSPPWDLPGNATQSGLISRTLGGGKTNYNGVRFEDKPGMENYWEQAERDMSRLTKNDEKHVIGANSVLQVGDSRSEVIAKDYNKNVAGMSITSIGAASMLSVGAAQISTIVGARAVNVGGVDDKNIGGASLVNVGGYHAMSVGGAWQKEIGGAASLISGGHLEFGTGGELILTGKVIKIIGQERVVIQSDSVELNPGDDDECGGGGGGGGGGLAALTSLAALVALKGAIALPLPLPNLPIPVPTPTTSPEPTTSPAPTTSPEPTPTPTDTPEPSDTFYPPP